MENYKNIDSESNINISNEVIATVAALAASEIEGVAGLSLKTISDAKNVLSKNNVIKAVKVNKADGLFAIDIHVAIHYGHNLSEVSKKVQETVYDQVANMTGINISAVNVNVTSIILPKK